MTMDKNMSKRFLNVKLIGIYTLLFKRLGWVNFLKKKNLLCSPRLHLVDQKAHKNVNIGK